LQEVLGDSELAIDMFVASHPHHFQAYQTIAGKPVVNSPGQFLDDFQDLECLHATLQLAQAADLDI